MKTLTNCNYCIGDVVKLHSGFTGKILDVKTQIKRNKGIKLIKYQLEIPSLNYFTYWVDEIYISHVVNPKSLWEQFKDFLKYCFK